MARLHEPVMTPERLKIIIVNAGAALSIQPSSTYSCRPMTSDRKIQEAPIMFKQNCGVQRQSAEHAREAGQQGKLVV